MDDSRQLVSELSTEQIEAVYQEHAFALERFLIGVLRDTELVGDVMQSTFVVLMEKGSSVKQMSAVKSWLFRVAYNEAMLVKRRQSVSRKHKERVAWRNTMTQTPAVQTVSLLMDQERVEMVQRALEKLSEDQQLVVRKRIFEGLKFREIADELGIPLGTVLARMHSSLKKLKPFFDIEDFHTE